MENKNTHVTSYIRGWHYKEFRLQLLTVLVTEMEIVTKRSKQEMLKVINADVFFWNTWSFQVNRSH